MKTTVVMVIWTDVWSDVHGAGVVSQEDVAIG
jgi:hypothetical protein